MLLIILTICLVIYKLKGYNFLNSNLRPKSHAFVSLPLQSSFYNDPSISAIIDYLRPNSVSRAATLTAAKAAHNFGGNTIPINPNNAPYVLEDEISRLTSLLIPYYFRFENGWYISPEQLWGQNWHPDFTVSGVDTSDGQYRGRALPHLIVEIKRPTKHGGVSWAKLLDQVWNPADSIGKQTNGRLWVIGQRGLEICLFKFDILRYQTETSPNYTNFIPLNLLNWSLVDFKALDIKVKTEIINKQEEVRVIYWKLDDASHAPFIHSMFMHVLTNNA